jgi:hypothetical protein
VEDWYVSNFTYSLTALSFCRLNKCAQEGLIQEHSSTDAFSLNKKAI